jgi:two-component system, NarL family, response regulator DesR
MIRILLAEDSTILRDTLVAVLDLQEDLEVVAQVARGDEIVGSVRTARPDVAILDIDLPGTDGVTAAATLHSEAPDCKVLILTALAHPANLKAALGAHVAGFLPKDTPAVDLIRAIREVASGARVVDSSAALAALESRPSPLTQRETDVLRLHSEGLDPREIAATLFLSYGTVRNYLASATDKLDAKNRIHAIRIATEAGWL